MFVILTASRETTNQVTLMIEYKGSTSLHQSLPLDTVQSQQHPLPIFTTYFHKIHPHYFSLISLVLKVATFPVKVPYKFLVSSI
jgi:hypothetical protein